MTDTPHLLSIGEFSSRSRLSVRMLRHYDAHGVLVSAQVDASSGYRRYAVEQLTEASWIRRLRDVGFGVSAIAAVLAVRGTAAYEHALVLQRETLARDLAAATERIALLDALIDHGGIPMSITVTRRTVPARTLVGLRGTVSSYDHEGELWARFMPELTAQGLTPVGPGGVIENDPDYRESDVDETVWLPVAPGTTAGPPLLLLDLPAVEVAMAEVTGPYSLITEAHSRIEDFLREEGRSVAARDSEAPVEQRVFNVYLNDPGQAAPEELRTQVCVPLA